MLKKVMCYVFFWPCGTYEPFTQCVNEAVLNFARRCATCTNGGSMTKLKLANLSKWEMLPSMYPAADLQKYHNDIYNKFGRVA